jgi:hypothetical protein
MHNPTLWAWWYLIFLVPPLALLVLVVKDLLSRRRVPPHSHSRRPAHSKSNAG